MSNTEANAAPATLAYAAPVTLAYAAPATLAKAAAPVLTFCVEATEFPPYNYFVRKEGARTGELAGYDIDLLEQVFGKTGVGHKVIALPWRRCLKEVQEGLIDGAMSASLNDERRRLYLPSDAYYYLTPSYFYLTADVPKPPDIKSVYDLAQHGPVCGIKGFNYVNFGWLDADKLNKINELSLLPSMLKLKRCRFFLERMETLTGTLLLNQSNALVRELSAQPVPGIAPEPFHMLISPKSPHAALIRERFNQKVETMRANGELDALLRHHLKRLQQE
ncbi:ABC transporter substrate-binding protein [Shewanella sp. JM162201]|uniref:ABC transporter substrate-binding protein n=1 Tax=Shewanella jiangmenensis TaxID=2837387 RepID=A0ABS5V144_9GAMM|nr:transporter substrate-binding domain-containing protein [Shewanella jiangmenensis]MBT1444194.1 ABC transporter substrate-binding protein [Shewanella jiangmenensis]